MHEVHDIEFKLWDEAELIRDKYNGAQVVIILGGDKSANIERTMISSTMHNGERLRDLLGLIESAKQIESLKHFKVGDFGIRMNETKNRRMKKIQQTQMSQPGFEMKGKEFNDELEELRNKHNIDNKTRKMISHGIKAQTWSLLSGVLLVVGIWVFFSSYSQWWSIIPFFLSAGSFYTGAKDLESFEAYARHKDREYFKESLRISKNYEELKNAGMPDLPNFVIHEKK